MPLLWITGPRVRHVVLRSHLRPLVISLWSWSAVTQALASP
ncbi:MAGIX isoform 8 [Pongo abelii]|uniref:MAGIX isoform 8 n=1 Tax=Pongo abelii TaxID=9601 RepID=A0A2J8R8B7_PONAB|nr:MAGIX isoform 8 [Pongo abelii]